MKNGLKRRLQDASCQSVSIGKRLIAHHDADILFAHSWKFRLKDDFLVILANVDFGDNFRHRHPRQACPAYKPATEKAVEDPVHLRSHLGERVLVARHRSAACLLLLDFLCHGDLLSLLHASAILLLALPIRSNAMNARHEAHRWTSTGILECVRTLTVSLPRTIAEMPWRPCEAMTIRSQPFDSAVSMIAW